MAPSDSFNAALSEADYTAAANAAMGFARELPGYTVSWGELIATAQYALARVSRIESVEYSTAPANDAALDTAARILDAASEKASVIPDERGRLGLLSALSFSLDGNSTAAFAVVERVLTFYRPTSAEWCLIATYAPRLLPRALGETRNFETFYDYLQALNSFLLTGVESLHSRLRDLLARAVISCDESYPIALLRPSIIALQRTLSLAAAAVLRPYIDALPVNYIRSLVDEGKAALLPPQKYAITNGLLSGTDNSLISLPTSTGKTLLGELTLLTALNRRPGLVCYVAPYIAIGRQVATQVERRAGQGYKVHRLFGEFQAPPELQPGSRSEIVVATIERFDALLRSSDLLRQAIRTVIIDEAHAITSGARGARLEGICARLLMLRQRNPNCRLVLLSAVMSHLDSVASWLTVPDRLQITSKWRPTSRRLAFWKQEGVLEWIKEERSSSIPEQQTGNTLGRRVVPWPNPGINATNNQAALRILRPKAYENIAYLTELLYRDLKGPVLCVCSRKATTRNVAQAISDRFPISEPLPQYISQLLDLIRTRYPYLKALSRILERRIAYHNAALPSEVRAGIEMAASRQELIAVTSTTTLAEGVDLPFRTTIIADWLLWNGTKEVPMAPLLFRNILGRCGRAGVYTEGDTVVFDNPLGDAVFTHPSIRTMAQMTMLGESSANTSPVETASDDPNAAAIDAAVTGQILAAIGENPQTENVINVFQGSLLAGRINQSNALRHRFASAEDAILNEETGALARAASPLRLTTLGLAFNATGFSPNSCRRIVALLNDISAEPEFGDLCALLLKNLANLPEQTHTVLRKTVSSNASKCCVKPADFAHLTRRWLTSTPASDMFVALPYVQRSRRNPPVSEWLSGQTPSESWSATFDEFIDFSDSIFRHFLPWVLRACGILGSVSIQSWTTDFDWRARAVSLEDAHREIGDLNLELPLTPQ